MPWGKGNFVNEETRTAGCRASTEEGQPTTAERMNRIPASRHTKEIIFFVFVGWFAECIDLGGTSYLLPTIREFFDMSTALGGYYSSICFIGMFIGALFAGRIADKVGRKKTVVCAMTIWGIAGFLLVFSPNIVYLFAVRFVLGLGLGAQFPVAMSYVSEIVCAAERPKYMTMYQLMAPLAFAFAGLLTVLILPHFDWRGVYLAEALPALFIIGIIKVVPESPLWLESVGRHDEADEICSRFEAEYMAHHGELPEVVPAVHASSEEKASFRDLFGKKYLKSTIVICCVWFISMFSDYGLTTWLTTILVEKGFSIVSSTGFVAVGILGGIPAWFATSWATKKFGRKKVFLVAGIWTAVFGSIYGMSGSVTALIVFGALYQFGKYANCMLDALYTPELYETGIRGAGNGLGTACGRLGSIFGPIIMAFIFSAVGADMTVAIATGLVIVPGLIVFLFGPETKDKVF